MQWLIRASGVEKLPQTIAVPADRTRPARGHRPARILALPVVGVLFCVCAVCWPRRQLPDVPPEAALGAAMDPFADDTGTVCALLEDHWAARSAISREVLAGRMSLPAAAALFRNLNTANPIFPAHAFPDLFPGVSDDERLCRQVIAFADMAVHAEPGRSPAECRALVARLENELRRCQREGPVGLPERTMSVAGSLCPGRLPGTRASLSLGALRNSR